MNTQEKLAKIIRLTEELEARKALYEELDALTLELQAEGFSHALFAGHEITLRDNFAEKNVQWRMAAVRRYEVLIEEPGAGAARAKKAEKAEKKKAGGA